MNDQIIFFRVGNVTPPTGNVTLQSKNVTLQSKNVTLQSVNVTLQGWNVTLQGWNVTLQGWNVTLPTGNVTPQTGNVTENSGKRAFFDPFQQAFPLKSMYSGREESTDVTDCYVAEQQKKKKEENPPAPPKEEIKIKNSHKYARAKHETEFSNPEDGVSRDGVNPENGVSQDGVSQDGENPGDGVSQDRVNHGGGRSGSEGRTERIGGVLDSGCRISRYRRTPGFVARSSGFDISVHRDLPLGFLVHRDLKSRCSEYQDL